MTQPYGHQPRIVYDSLINPIVVDNPTVSQAYYGILCEEAPVDTYQVNGPSTPFQLHIDLLIPDPNYSLKGGVPNFDVTATITNSTGQIIAIVHDADPAHWVPFYEPFGKDHYLQGPSFIQTVPGGVYTIKVTSGTLPIKYVMAIGDEEVFPPQEIVNASYLSPRLKREFFMSETWKCPLCTSTTSTVTCPSPKSNTNACAKINIWLFILLVIVIVVIVLLIIVALGYPHIVQQSAVIT